MTARASFDTELEQLNIDLIKMGSMVEQAITKSICAMLTHEHELAAEVVAADRQVDDIEKMIEQRCLRLLMRQQPVARDLRAISTALKMITDLERIGDQAADIAELSTRFTTSTQLSFAKHIPQMSEITISMVKNCIDSFIKNDLDLAAKTMKRDDEVDHLFDVVKSELVTTIMNNKDCADEAIDLMMVAKYLERIGDHAVNVCEWVIFYSTGLHKKTQII